jgi:DNA-binding XRE family transcriptional regulator
MARTLNDVMTSLPKARRKRIEKRATDLIAEEASLQDLRKALGFTQVALAKKLNVGQDTVSRVETRADLLLSTLSGYVQAMGGELKLVAEFPDRPPVRLSTLQHLKDAAGSTRGRRTTTR